MTSSKSLDAADLFALLDSAYRRQAPACAACEFSFPFRTSATDSGHSNWSVIPSGECCGMCKHILEDLVAQHQATYRLADRYA